MRLATCSFHVNWWSIVKPSSLADCTILKFSSGCAYVHERGLDGDVVLCVYCAKKCMGLGIVRVVVIECDSQCSVIHILPFRWSIQHPIIEEEEE